MRLVYPAYGRDMMRRRLAGDHPRRDEAVLVALGFWPRPGEGWGRWPDGRFIVVTDDMPLTRLELRMLAGTVPIVAFDRTRLERARELALLITRIEPLYGVAYVLEYDLGVFAAVTKPDSWLNLTWTEGDYWKPLAEHLVAMAAGNHQGNERHVAA